MATKFFSSRINSYLPWFIASFFAFFQFLGQTAAGVMGSEWVKDFHLNAFGLSKLSAAFFYAYVLVQIPVGIIYDRYSTRYVLAISAFVLMGSNFLLAYTHSYAIAIVARFLMGAGSAFGFIGLLHVSANYFPARRFTMLVAVSESLAMIGVTIGVILLSWLVTHQSWRNVIFDSGLIMGLVFLTALFFVRDPANKQQQESSKQTLSFKVIFYQLKQIMTQPQVILSSVISFFIFSAISAFASLWGIIFLTQVYSFNHQAAANRVAMIFIGIAVGGPINGWLAKTINYRAVLLSIETLAWILMAITIFNSFLSPIVLYILFFLIGFCASVYILYFTVVKEAVDPSIRATALGTANMIIMSSGALMQLLIGWLLQNHDFHLSNTINALYRLSLGVLPLGMFIAFILTFWIREPGYSNSNKVS